MGLVTGFGIYEKYRENVVRCLALEKSRLIPTYFFIFACTFDCWPGLLFLFIHICLRFKNVNANESCPLDQVQTTYPPLLRCKSHPEQLHIALPLPPDSGRRKYIHLLRNLGPIIKVDTSVTYTR
jgi:hypothetical protein